MPDAGWPAGDAGKAGRRYLALHLPRLATERLRGVGALSAKGSAGPTATWGLRGGRKVLLALSAAAAVAGLRPEQALADARAALPGLRAEPEDPAAVAALLERLATWALRYGPLVGVDGDDALLLDVAGCAWRHGGAGHDAGWDGEAEAALRDDAVLRLARRGVAALGAVAGTPDAALALARGGCAVVVAPGDEAEAVSPLCLSVLPIDASRRAALRRLGLWRVGDVLALPRGPLARRFGAALPVLLDGVAGRATRSIRPLRPAPEFAVARDLPDPITTREAIDAVLLLLLDALRDRLAESGRGVRRLVLRAHGVDGGTQELSLGTVAPSRDPAHLFRLFRDKLEQLRPGFGFDHLALLAERTDPQVFLQGGLAGSAAAEAAGHAELAALLDRLDARLRVWRLEPRASHLPERAVERASPLPRPDAGVPEHWLGRPRPVRLLRRPEPVSVLAMLPDGPPARMTWRGRALRVRCAEGPERLEPEWWRDAPDRAFRDYWRVEVEGGERLWVCRVGEALPGLPARWFLHGYLP